MSAGTVQLDRYIAGQSALHLADPRAKVPVALGFILATGALPPGAWPWYAAMGVLVWGAVAASGVGLRPMATRSLIALPFALAALPTVFTRAGEPAAVLPLGPWTLVATDAGLAFCAGVFIKSWLCVTAASLLAATTPAAEIIDALYALRVPQVLVRVVAFMHRYLYVLMEEVLRMLRARTARSAAAAGRPAGGNVLWRARVTGGMAGALFIRTCDRAERVHMAMVARGFSGEFRQRPKPALGGGTVSIVVGLLAGFATVAVSAYLSLGL